ncbi:hypothetical protein RQP46_006852 [Phenoliferia psychrophenolica]
MSVAAEPQIKTQSFVIDLPDPALPPFFVQLVELRGSVVITVGTAPTPYAIAGDFACAMHTAQGPPSSTALTPNASTSLSMSAKFSRRYKRQVFLSLDLAAFTTQGRPANNLVLTLEKALLMKLDPFLKETK